MADRLAALKERKAKAEPDPSAVKMEDSNDLLKNIHAESGKFLLPEDPVDIDLQKRKYLAEVRSYSSKPSTVGLATAYDEISRNYCTVHVAKDMPEAITLVDGVIKKSEYSTSSQRILQSYNPGYTAWMSSFRKSPDVSRHLVSGRVLTDVNFLLRFDSVAAKIDAFEPIYGYGFLCTILNETVLRLSESIYFDLTPESIRKDYKFAYVSGEKESDKSPSFRGKSINIADSTDSGHMKMFKFTIPEELRKRGIYLVVQLSKILSGDADTAVKPYQGKVSPPTDLSKYRETCYRLVEFRQPLGLGAVRLIDEQGNVGAGGKPDLTCKIYADKACRSDSTFLNIIRDLYPVEGVSTSSSKLELIDLEIKLSAFDLGGDDQVQASLAALNLVPSATAETSNNLHFIPSQLRYGSCPLRYSSSTELPSKNTSIRAIREVLPLLPPSLALTLQVNRQVKVAADNTMFFQLLHLEKFSERNLSLKVELVQFAKAPPKTNLHLAEHKILSQIYNHSSILGPELVSRAFTRVSHHTKNPVSCDEIKIQLPDHILSLHYLKLTVLHVRVKDPSKRGSIFTLKRSTVTDGSDTRTCGVGFLPLLCPGAVLVKDQEHVLNIPEMDEDGNVPTTSTNTADLPSIKFRTISLSSFLSTDRHVQSLIRYQPMALGVAPSSIMSHKVSSQMLEAMMSKPPPAEKLLDAFNDIGQAQSLEINRHFFILMRIMTRALLGGVGLYSENYSNPYQHADLRCQAFLGLVLMMGKLGSRPGAVQSKEGTMTLEKEFLHAYVDFIFDEETPLSLVNMNPSSVSTADQVNHSEKEAADSHSSSRGEGLIEGKTSDFKSTKSSAASSPATEKHNRSSQDLKEEGKTVKPQKAPTTEKGGLSIPQQANSRSKSIAEPSKSSSADGVGLNEISVVLPRDKRRASLPTDIGSSAPKERHGRSLSNASEHNEVRDSVVGMEDEESNSVGEIENERDTMASSTMSMTSSFHTGRLVIGQVDGEEDKDELGALYLSRTAAALPPSLLHMGTLSDGRKSWGRFITNAMWNSGQLPALGGKAKKDVAESRLSIKYLDEIANHLVLQFERIMSEMLISEAVTATTNEMRRESEEEMSKSRTRSSSNDQQTNFDRTLKLKSFRKNTMSRMVSIQKHKDSLGYLMPFEEEHGWFEAVLDEAAAGEESPTLSTPVATTIGERAAKQMSMKDMNEERDESARIAANTAPAIVQERRRISKNVKLDIQPVLPIFDLMESYRMRSKKFPTLTSVRAAEEGKDPSVLHFHWWPWMYEVLVYQWSAVLAIVLSSSKLISTKNMDHVVGKYPFTFTSGVQDSKTLSNISARQIRSLLIDYGPVLLHMIFKSLALRIKRENKRPPVLLDETFLNALENLVMLLGVEAATLVSGLWKSQQLVASLANFLRSLFALAAPNQVIKLVQSFFRAIKKRGKAEEVKLRLQMVEELSLFDHFVAVNFPYTLDAPLECFQIEARKDLSKPGNVSFAQSYTSQGIRSSLGPAPFALTHMIISEIMTSYRKDDSAVKASAVEILRDLVVRQNFDSRYQSYEEQQRIACMYIPLVDELVQEQARLESSRFDTAERRELLIVLLHVVQGLPDRILREQVRRMCIPPRPTYNRQSKSSLNGKDIKLTFNTLANVVSVTPRQSLSSNNSSSPSAHSTPRVLSLKMNRALTTPQVNSYIPQMPGVTEMPVMNLLLLLHQILDTFEMPITLTTRIAQQMLSPSISVDDATAKTKTSTTTVTRRSTLGDDTSQPVKSGGEQVANKLGQLDQMMQNRSKSTVAAHRGISQSSVVTKNTERKWYDHARRMSSEELLGKDKLVELSPVTTKVLASSVKHVCWSATHSVMEVLLVIFSECPTMLSQQAASPLDQMPFILRDSNIDQSMLVGIKNLRIIHFMRLALTVLLHALFCNQDDDAIISVFSTATSVVRDYGAKVFLVAVEDALQDWMRITLLHCADPSDEVGQAASNFLLFLMRATFYYLGSLNIVSTTVLAVINDVLDSILQRNKKIIQTHSDEDKVLSRLHGAIQNIRMMSEAALNVPPKQMAGYSDVQLPDAAGKKGHRKNPSGTVAVEKFTFTAKPGVRSAFAKATVELVNNLQIIFKAHELLRRFLSHPSAYDFEGANMLDGPFDVRASTLFQETYQKRRAVKPDSDDKKAKSLFQMEEVMLHFIKAANVYDPMLLPRFHMYWLENVARLHDSKNRAEGAEIRWQIFCLCKTVETTWNQLWAPRPPLEWTRRGEDPPAPSVVLPKAGMTKSSKKPIDKTDRNFYRVLQNALDGRPYRPWVDYHQYLLHMETALTVVTQRFCSLNLIHLAERSSQHLMRLYRLLKQPGSMLTEFNRISSAMKNVMDNRISSNIAIGTYYRVIYKGITVASNLRDKEFIFRNANNLHVAEFKKLVLDHLNFIVAEGVEVKIVTEADTTLDFEDPKVAYCIMNSVKLIMNKNSTLSLRALNNELKTQRQQKVHDPIAATLTLSDIQRQQEECSKHVEILNQVSQFQYSVPFTKNGGKAHAKQIEDQWMRTTVLSVEYPFPYIMTRQEVKSREVKELSPIAVAIVDIEERIETMEMELESVVQNPSDCNNLMRIIQGTVLPQVNAGAGEVAKVFLGSHKLQSDSVLTRMRIEKARDTEKEEEEIAAALAEEKEQFELALRLKMTLIDFLSLSKRLLAKARRHLLPGSSENGSEHGDKGLLASTSSHSTGMTAMMGLAGSNAADPEAQLKEQQQLEQYSVWQYEMEKGFDKLVQSILPFIEDLKESDLFQSIGLV